MPAPLLTVNLQPMEVTGIFSGPSSSDEGKQVKKITFPADQTGAIFDAIYQAKRSAGFFVTGSLTGILKAVRPHVATAAIAISATLILSKIAPTYASTKEILEKDAPTLKMIENIFSRVCHEITAHPLRSSIICAGTTPMLYLREIRNFVKEHPYLTTAAATAIITAVAFLYFKVDETPIVEKAVETGAAVVEIMTAPTAADPQTPPQNLNDQSVASLIGRIARKVLRSFLPEYDPTGKPNSQNGLDRLCMHCSYVIGTRYIALEQPN